MRVSKMTSQRTRSWNVARRQLANGDFGVLHVRDTFFFKSLHEGSLQKLILKCEVYMYF